MVVILRPTVKIVLWPLQTYANMCTCTHVNYPPIHTHTQVQAIREGKNGIYLKLWIQFLKQTMFWVPAVGQWLIQEANEAENRGEDKNVCVVEFMLWRMKQTINERQATTGIGDERRQEGRVSGRAPSEEVTERPKESTFTWAFNQESELLRPIMGEGEGGNAETSNEASWNNRPPVRANGQPMRNLTTTDIQLEPKLSAVEGATKGLVEWLGERGRLSHLEPYRCPLKTCFSYSVMQR